jgi:two-component system, chemotaxis family, protein-glutamate methylesterase/glutaminase
MTHHRCITIGASAGGYGVILDIISQLPADLPAPVFVVMHIPAYERSYLPEILSNKGHLEAIHPTDGMAIQEGVVYVAPPDHHLLIDDGRVAVKKGPKENGFRPSIDALFRSAAYSYGPDAIGVVLSGALNDGASGLWTIKRLGGTAIVQDPFEAQFPSMPRSALEYVDADYRVPAREISGLLVRLASEPVEKTFRRTKDNTDLEERIAKEVQIAAGQDISHKMILGLGELTPFTCTECKGVLVKIVEDKLTRFRCHTGHGYTEDALLEGVTRATGELIWQTVRSLQESEMLLEHVGRHIQAAGDPARAQKFLSRAHELGKHANQYHKLAIDLDIDSSTELEGA